MVQHLVAMAGILSAEFLMPEHQPLDRRALQGDGEQKVLQAVYYGVGMSTICASASLGLFLNLSAVDHHHSTFFLQDFLPFICYVACMSSRKLSSPLAFDARLVSRHIQSGYRRTDGWTEWFVSEQEFC